MKNSKNRFWRERTSLCDINNVLTVSKIIFSANKPIHVITFLSVFKFSNKFQKLGQTGNISSEYSLVHPAQVTTIVLRGFDELRNIFYAAKLIQRKDKLKKTLNSRLMPRFPLCFPSVGPFWFFLKTLPKASYPANQNWMIWKKKFTVPCLQALKAIIRVFYKVMLFLW